MAVYIINSQSTKLEIQGLSTDTKPILQKANTGSTFFEVDTAIVYLWHIDGWKQL